MRIVLDTNVVMSARLWRGKPYQLLQSMRQRTDLQLRSRPALLEELADVLSQRRHQGIEFVSAAMALATVSASVKS